MKEEALTSTVSNSKGRQLQRAVARSVEQLEDRVLLAGAAITTLGEFGTAGEFSPAGTIVRDSTGAIYGIATLIGGQPQASGIFKLASASSTPTLVATFPAVGSFSQVPIGLVIDSNDNIFGATGVGGDSTNDGTVFELAKGASSITTLAQFTQATTGNGPNGNIVMDNAGNIFGVCQNSGPAGGGTVWRFNKSNSTISELASFPSSSGIPTEPGANSIAIDRSGNLFGTTAGQPQAAVYGTVWEVHAGQSTIQTLATFNSTNGSVPTGPIVIDASGNVFGATEFGGANNNGGSPAGLGTVYEVASGSGAITSLASFSGDNGEYPVGGLVGDANGNLFGTASKGGNVSAQSVQGAGTVFEVVKGAKAITLVAAFSETDGKLPQGSVLVDPSGNIFGTSSGGGSQLGGTVFEILSGSSGGGGGGGSSTLAATATVKSPATLIAGQKISATIGSVLTNSSASAVSDAISFAVYLSADGTVDNNSIKLVSSAPKRFTIKAHQHVSAKAAIKTTPAATPPGTYHYIVEWRRADGSTTDFQASNTVTVAAPVIDIGGSFVKFVGTAKRGKPLKETINVTNTGANVAAVGTLPIVVGYLPADPNAPLGPLPVIIKKKVSLKPGRSTRIVLSLKAPPSAGTYSVFINLDATGFAGATDSNPANNALTSPTNLVVS